MSVWDGIKADDGLMEGVNPAISNGDGANTSVAKAVRQTTPWGLIPITQYGLV